MPQAKQTLSCNCALGLEELIVSSGTVPFTGGYFISRSTLESKLKLNVAFYVFCQQTLFWCIQASECFFWWFWGIWHFVRFCKCFVPLIFSYSDLGSGWISHKRLVDQFYSSQMAITVETWLSWGIHHSYCKGMGSINEILFLCYSATKSWLVFLGFVF